MNNLQKPIVTDILIKMTLRKKIDPLKSLLNPSK